MISKAVMLVHILMCLFFIIFSRVLDLPVYLIICAALSGVFGVIVMSAQVKTSVNLIKFCTPMFMLGLVTLYGFEMNRMGVVTVFILAIACISSLYADFRVTGLVIFYSLILYLFCMFFF